MTLPPNQNYTETINGVPFKMIFVEGGNLTIKHDGGEEKYVIPDFYLCEVPCFQDLWETVMDFNPSWEKGKKFPVEEVSWKDIVLGSERYGNISFFDKLSEQSVYDGYKLPTAEMWRYAASGGKRFSNGSLYSGSNILKEVAWFKNNSNRNLRPVRMKLPNELGLFDMSGLIREWCINRLHIGRITMGGSYYDEWADCTIASSHFGNETGRGNAVGFRIARY